MAPDTTQTPADKASGMPALVVRLSGGAPAVDYCGTGQVARLLVGRGVDEVEPLLGRVFTICPAAQQLAARLALAAASGEEARADEVAPLLDRARAEALREHALRILLGWTAALGDLPDRGLAAEVNRQTRTGSFDGAAEQVALAVFGGSAASWLADEGLAEWASRGNTAAARFMAGALADHGIPQAPASPAGTLVERHAAHRALAGLAPGSVAAFHAARLADLARLVSRDDCEVPRAQSTGPGAAQVTVDCSRGALTHRACVAQGRASGYEIVSPTDAAFTSSGFGRRWLDEVAAVPAGEREGAVRAIVAALDPCTDWRVEAG